MSRKSMLLALIAFVATFGFGAPVNAQAGYATSWLGNSFGGAGGAWMQIAASGTYTEANGATYVNSYYDEAGREAGIYLDGAVVGKFDDLHGWGRYGGQSITADDNYVYVGMVQRYPHFTGTPPPGYPASSTDASGVTTSESWWGVRRYFKNGLPAPWPQAGRVDGAANSIVGLIDDSMIIVTDITTPALNPPTDTTITGLAVVNGLLYVSEPHTDTIKVYNVSNASHVSYVSSWSVANPGAILYDKQTRTLWIAQMGDDTNVASVSHYSLDGTKLPQQINGVGVPRALAFNPQGNLLVADNGADQQVKIYTDINTLPLLASTLGDQGGIYGGVRGTVGDYRFNGLTGVSCDAIGNMYVSSNGSENLDVPGTGSMLASYSPDLKRRWKLESEEFMDCADVAPESDGADIFTKEEHFKLDLTDPTARPTYAGYTVDRLRYPNDSRLHVNTSTTPLIRNIQGKRFLFVQDTYCQLLQIYRFDAQNAGETAIPSGLIAVKNTLVGRQSQPWPPATVQPAQGPWIWRDLDGNGDFFQNGVPQKNEFDNGLGVHDPWLWASVWGWNVDDNGDIWQVSRSFSPLNGGIRHFRCLGLDKVGNPIYTMAAMQTLPRPAPFDGTAGSINRIEYIASTDTMYLSGYTNAYPMAAGEWGFVGRVIVRYDHWSTPNRTQTYQIVLPWNMTTNPLIGGRTMSISGGKIFVGYLSGTTTDYQNNGGQIAIYNSDTGAPLGALQPGSEVGSYSGWIDTPSGIRAYTRSTGEQLIFAEEDYMGKVLMYRIPAPGAAVATTPAPTNGTGTGLTGRYFNGAQNSAFGKLTATRIDPTLNFLWTGAPATGVAASLYSVQWTGKVQARYSERYTFHTTSRNGVRVWVNGKMVIDSWQSHQTQDDFGSTYLQAGKLYSIRVEYYQLSGLGAMTLSWSSARQPMEVIPQTQLYPDGSQ